MTAAKAAAQVTMIWRFMVVSVGLGWPCFCSERASRSLPETHRGFDGFFSRAAAAGVGRGGKAPSPKGQKASNARLSEINAPEACGEVLPVAVEIGGGDFRQ